MSKKTLTPEEREEKLEELREEMRNAADSLKDYAYNCSSDAENIVSCETDEHIAANLKSAEEHASYVEEYMDELRDLYKRFLELKGKSAWSGSSPSRRFIMDTLMQTLEPGSPSSRAISQAFTLMGIAEEELDKAGLREKSRHTNLFMLLMPSAEMLPMVEQVYRLHARELCQRAARAKAPPVNLADPTDMEVLVALHLASLKAPLIPSAARIAAMLFDRVKSGWARPEDKLSLSDMEALAQFKQQTRVSRTWLKTEV